MALAILSVLYVLKVIYSESQRSRSRFTSELKLRSAFARSMTRELLSRVGCDCVTRGFEKCTKKVWTKSGGDDLNLIDVMQLQTLRFVLSASLVQ